MKLSFSTAFLLPLVFVLFTSCKKNDAPGGSGGNFTATASFTIDGDNFHKQIITIIGAVKTTTHCSYSSQDKITSLTINDQADINAPVKNQFFLIFNGSSPATQHAGDAPSGGTFSSIYFQVEATDKKGIFHSYLFENESNTPGIFSISKYGKVGDTVEGSFSGILVNEDGAPVIHISNGTFSITRSKDMD